MRLILRTVTCRKSFLILHQNEPNLTPKELQQLDAVADRVEVRRLQNMSVLINIEDMNADDIYQVKTLSTRFVRTWRAKVINSKQVWLRRSRLVAREFAWIDERLGRSCGMRP